MNFPELVIKMKKFKEIYYIYIPNKGHLVWRYGTSYNVEILDIEAYKKRQGIGRKLIKRLVQDLDKNPPSNIFGFTKETNEEAQAFYRALGFELSPVIKLLYRRGGVIFINSYKKLRDL